MSQMLSRIRKPSKKEAIVLALLSGVVSGVAGGVFEFFFHDTAPLQITATDRSVAAGGDINGPVNIGSDETTTRRTIAEGLRPLEERLTSIEGLLARWDERRSGNSPTQASAKENTNKNPIEAAPLFRSSEINLASLNSSVLPINGITGKAYILLSK
jgi:hypothetical protein